MTCYKFKCSHWWILKILYKICSPAVISTNESTRIITGHVIYNPAYTYKFQLKTTKVSNVKRKRTIERLKKKESVVHEENLKVQKEIGLEIGREIPVTIEVQEELQNNGKIDNQEYVVVLGRRNITVDLGIILSNLVEKKYPTSFFSIVLTFIAALPRYSIKKILEFY